MPIAQAVAAGECHGHWARRNAPLRELPYKITIELQVFARAAQIARYFLWGDVLLRLTMLLVVPTLAADLTSSPRRTEVAFVLIPRTAMYTLVWKQLLAKRKIVTAKDFELNVPPW